METKNNPPTHTQGEVIANSIMPFILLGVEPTEESRKEVKKSIAKSIDYAIQKALVGMIRLDSKTNKCVNMHDELVTALRQIMQSKDITDLMRNDYIDEYNELLKQAEQY